LSVKKWI